jgi:hypothetical protein
MKAESWEIPFSGKPEVMRGKTRGSLNSPRVFGSFGHIARCIVCAKPLILESFMAGTVEADQFHVALGERGESLSIYLSSVGGQ